MIKWLVVIFCFSVMISRPYHPYCTSLCCKVQHKWAHNNMYHHLAQIAANPVSQPTSQQWLGGSFEFKFSWHFTVEQEKQERNLEKRSVLEVYK